MVGTHSLAFLLDHEVLEVLKVLGFPLVPVFQFSHQHLADLEGPTSHSRQKSALKYCHVHYEMIESDLVLMF